MKIINEKGKLFGIINIIDLIVILVIALLVVGGAKRIVKSRPEVISEVKKATVTIEISDIRKPTVEGFAIGDPIYHYDKGQYLGKIVDKKVTEYREKVESGDGKWNLAVVPEKYVATLTVEADAKETTEAIIVGGEQMRIGAQFRLKTKKATAFGTVLGVEVK